MTAVAMQRSHNDLTQQYKWLSCGTLCPHSHQHQHTLLLDLLIRVTEVVTALHSNPKCIVNMTDSDSEDSFVQAEVVARQSEK